MPRDGSGIYSRPPGTNAVPDTTIESTKYNNNVADVETDLNAPRPIIAGGTGANSVTQARANLQAERAMAPVTDYNTHVWENGSFWSASGATGAPAAGNFSGIAYVANNDPNFVTVEARDISTGVLYVRQKNTTWGSWIAQPVNPTADYVNVTGDAMTGGLTLNYSAPLITLNKTNGNANTITGSQASQSRWYLQLGDNGVESGSNTGSDFKLFRLSDAGGILGTVINIYRSTGDMTLSTTTISSSTTTGALQVAGGVGIGGQLNVLGAQNKFYAAGALPSPALSAVIGIAFNVSGIATRAPNDGGSYHHGFENQAGSIVGVITTTAAATQYNTSSDASLKDDLRSFDAGSIIDRTDVYDFKWKSTGERSYGVLAQQAIDIYPTAVTHTEQDTKSGLNEWWGVDYSKYVPVILQELKALRARVAELEGKLAGKPA